MIPPHIKEALDDYVKNGTPRGHFITAVLENNLRNAIGKADEANLAALVEIVQYIHWEVPGNCHGSKEAVTKWIEHEGQKGEHKKVS